MSETVINYPNSRSKRLFFNVYIFMIAFFIMKLGQFIIIPFLAIYLSQFSLSPLSIGLIIASGQLSYSITSLLTGSLLDRYNPQQIFSMTLFGAGIAYWYLYESSSLMCFILFNALIGTFRAIFDNASKTLLVTGINDKHRAFALGFRYALLNLAAALGPLISAYYLANNSTQLFKAIACGYLLTGFVLFLCWSKNTNARSTSSPSKSIAINEIIQLIKIYPSVKILLIISFLCYCLYSQIASSLAHYVLKQFDNGVVVYSNMLILNATTCVFLQIFVGPMIRKVSHMMLASIGLSLLAIGFTGFCFAQNSMTLNFFMLILSIGEVIFFPLNDVLLAHIAPPNLIGSCYGILNASTIGLAVGPIVGGGISQLGSHYYLFLICSLTSLLTIFLYKKLLLRL